MYKSPSQNSNESTYQQVETNSGGGSSSSSSNVSNISNFPYKLSLKPEYSSSPIVLIDINFNHHN